MVKILSENARDLYRLCLHDKLLTANVIEHVYKHAEYPGKLVVDNVISLLRDENEDDDEEYFINYFSTSLGKTENVEWYLMHILYTVAQILPDKSVTAYSQIYQWW